MASSEVTASLRVVGLYCLLEKKTLPGVTQNSKVSDFMQGFVNLDRDFNYTAAPLPSNGKMIVDKMSYTFTSTSTKPPNAAFPSLGFREEANVISSDVSNVWQYYRTIRGTIAGKPVEIKLPTVGQPSFADLAFNDGFNNPDGFVPNELVLTWRLARIQLAPDKAMDFMGARMNALAA